MACAVSIAAPVERVVDHDRLGHSPGVVAEIARQVFGRVADDVAKHFVRPIYPARDRFGVGIDEQLRAVKAQPAFGIVGSGNARSRKAVPAAHRAEKCATPGRCVRSSGCGRFPGVRPGESKRQRSTEAADSEKIAKFTPLPSQVAPRGYG